MVLACVDGAWSGRAVSCRSISACVVRQESRDRGRRKWPDGRHWIIAGSRIARLTRILRLVERQSTRLREAPRTRSKKSNSPEPGAVDADSCDCLRKKEVCRRGDSASKPALVDPGLRGRELPETVPQEQTTIESAKENPSDLDTKVLESEAMLNRLSKLGVFTVTSRIVVPWHTRAQWRCLGFICGLVRSASASDEAMVNGYWSKRVSGTTTGRVRVRSIGVRSVRTDG